MKTYALTLVTLFSSLSFADDGSVARSLATPFSSCAVNAQETDPDGVLELIEKSKGCHSACATVRLCGLGDQRDAPRAYAAQRKCEKAFAPHSNSAEKAYRTALKQCENKMKAALKPDSVTGNPEGGTLAISAAAFCDMDAACYFYDLFQPYQL